MASRRVHFAADTAPLMEDCISALANSHVKPLSASEAQQHITFLLKGFKRDERGFHQAMADQTRPSISPDLPLRRMKAILKFNMSLVDAAGLQGEMDSLVEWLDLALECMQESEEVNLPYLCFPHSSNFVFRSYIRLS